MSNELLKRIFSSIVLIPIIFFSIIKGEFYFNILLIVLISFALYEWDKLVNQKIIKTTGFGFIFFVFILSFFLRNNYNPEIFLFLILICVSTDLGGYIFGKILKGPKLSKVSPNKTYSGMIGSFLLSILITPLIFINFAQLQNLILLAIILCKNTYIRRISSDICDIASGIKILC